MAVDRTDIRSRALDLLRFPLAVVIVAVHVFMGNEISVMGTEYSWSDSSAAGVGELFVRAFLSGQSVPIYFFISGYVFFLGFNLSMESYARKMKNRFKSLFIPYVLWNTLAILFLLLPFIPVFNGFFPNVDLDEPLDFSIGTILRMYWECGFSNIRPDRIQEFYNIYPVDNALWFVRDLMIVAVTTPLINILLKRFGAVFPMVLGVVWFTMSNFERTHLFQLVTAYFFFTWGAYMSFNKKDMIVEFKKWRGVSFVAYPLVATIVFVCFWALDMDRLEIIDTGSIGNLVYLKNLAVLAGLPFAYNLAVLLIERYNFRMAKSLTAASFFIYAGHMLIIGYIVKGVSMILIPDTGLKALAMLIVSTALIVGILLGVYIFMKRFCPSLLKPFTGGRV